MDHEVERSQAGGGLLHRAPALVGTAEVRADQERAPSQRANRAGRFLRLRPGQVMMDRDVRAGTRQRQGDRTPDADGRPGYERDRAGKP